MKPKILLLSFFLFSILLGAQKGTSSLQKFNVSGTINDKETNQPLEYATVVLSPKNGKQVTGGLTDAKGMFSIEVDKGIYDISIEFLSFKTYKLSDKSINANLKLGTISLAADSQSLDEVEIIAEKTTVQIRLDKKIYNVGKDLTVRGGTVSDVLDNVPSVSVDVEGNVALRGNDNVQILINGKPSGLVGLSSTDALRQLPADAIEKVEVITSPSARYDAEGTGGILNIILRRSKIQGFNGAITTNIGYPEQAGISGNLNYRTGDINIFTTAGYNYRESPGNAFTATDFESGLFLQEERKFDRIRKGLTINTGIEWYVNETASITASFLYQDSDNESNTVNDIFIRNTDNSEERSERFDPEFEDDKTIQYALNYVKDFKKEGHKLTADFQYEKNQENENSLISQDGEDIETVATLEGQQRILLQTDYVLPINENTQFEFGYRGNFNKLDTDYIIEQNTDTGFELNTDLSNQLLFDETLNALYSQYGTKIDKFSVLLGLRMETTRFTINQVTTNDKQIKTYANLFPTVNLGYEIDEDQNITFGYNRRIRRPRSRYINPFPSRSSATNLFQGNPDLNPSFSDAIDFGYLNRFNKVTLTTSVYFQREKDAFNFVSLATDNFYVFETNETINENDPNIGDYDPNDLVPVIQRTPINLATNDRYGFEFTLTYSPQKKWRINGNFNLFKSITKGGFGGEDFGAENTSWFMRLNNKVTLPGNIEWQTRLNYQGPSENAQNNNKGIFSSDIAFSKDLFKEKASLAFNINDVLNSRKRVSESFTETFTGTSEFQRRERSFNLSFTYRFNQKKKPERQRNNNNNNNNNNDSGGEFGS